MSSLPLITHDRPDAVLAYRGGKAISAAEFLRDVRALAAQLPAGAHVLNACADRYRFTVGLAASLMRNKCSILPTTHAPEVIRELRSFAPDVFCLSDDPHCPIELPQLLYPEPPVDSARRRPADEPWSVPQIDSEQLAAYIFTSGSTGSPQPHAKLWGLLVRSVCAEAARLPGLDQRGCAVLGTVPAQHMYGFESTVLLPLQSGGALCAERPFFPVDISAILQALPAPRVLFTTPVHLRALLAAELALPALELIVSATALLPVALAREVERRFAVPLYEIYGSTETGEIATRRTTLEDPWRLLPGIRLTTVADRCWAQGGHVEPAMPLADVLEPLSEHTFLLHGRTADLVNIAGKRSSLAHLNHQLNSIPGVLDGEFFMPDTADASSAGVSRLAAFVVAPQLNAAAITQGLRARIDAVFLPRPLLLVAQLPRNATGKLTQHALRALAAQAELGTVKSVRTGRQSVPFSIAPDHPALAGHFPNSPVVPGVVLLDEALHAIECAQPAGGAAAASAARELSSGPRASRWHISTVKFHHVVLAGEALRLDYESQPDGGARFELWSAHARVVSGTIERRFAGPSAVMAL